MVALRQEVLESAHTGKWAIIDDLVTVGDCIFVSATSPCVPHILAGAHSAGHGGVQKMLHLVRANFFIPGAHTLVQDFVRACSVCQKNKIEQLHPTGLLQPLEVSLMIWVDITLDFIEGFPRVHDKSVVLIVVNKLSKYAHFIPLGHPYTATTVVRSFIEIARLHGLPSSIVSDRDTTFTSTFWRKLFRLSIVRLNMSMAFHPQSDGQSEAVNKIITMYL
jgi:hypothetical protein